MKKIDEFFNEFSRKGEYLKNAAFLGYLCLYDGEHVTSGTIEAEDAWHRRIGEAFEQLLTNKTFANDMSKYMKEFAELIDSIPANNVSKDETEPVSDYNLEQGF